MEGNFHCCLHHRLAYFPFSQWRGSASETCQKSRSSAGAKRVLLQVFALLLQGSLPRLARPAPWPPTAGADQGGSLGGPGSLLVHHGSGVPGKETTSEGSVHRPSPQRSTPRCLLGSHTTPFTGPCLLATYNPEMRLQFPGLNGEHYDLLFCQ